jgi:hypothetical protein
MSTPPIVSALERRRKVANIFRTVLSPYNLEGAVDEREIQIRTEVIVDNPGNQALSNTILNAMFPREPVPAELLHYTTLQGLEGIAGSGELRLYPIRKHIDEGELQAFAQAHGLRGYLQTAEGEPFYKELSDDLFYTSLVRPNQRDQALMWNVFAQRSGARLRMRLVPGVAELRPIQYGGPFRTLLTQLNDALAVAGEPPFLPWTISRIGGFYLPSSLRLEEEVRLMVKRFEGGANIDRLDGRYEYWPIPINADNGFCRIELLEIVPGPAAELGDIRAAVAGTQFEHLVRSDATIR